jgi:hypothetical protein
MPNGSYYRRQAEICLVLARACDRSAIAKRLLVMAADFQAKAGNGKADALAAKPALAADDSNPRRLEPIVGNRASRQ